MTNGSDTDSDCDCDCDGSETTLGSPPPPTTLSQANDDEVLSPCLWATHSDSDQPGSVIDVSSQAADLPSVGSNPSVLTQRDEAHWYAEDEEKRNAIVVPLPLEAKVSPAPAHTSPAAKKALLLSPASQLDVLAQISQLAERNVPETASPALTSPAREHPHVWMRAAHRSKKRRAGAANASEDGSSTGSKAELSVLLESAAGTAKKRRTVCLPAHSDKLAADMLDWETCSEDLFVSPTASGDEWVYEAISDSDFES